MLSCLVPRFGQEDNIMPSSAKFALQFSSLTSGLPKDDEGQADYCISCPQCHQRLPGLAALKEHLETTHSIVKLENGLPTISTPSPPYHHTEQHHNSHQQPPITSSLSSPSTSANVNHVAAGSNGDVIISREGGRSTSPSSSSILGEPYACSPCSASFPNRDLLEKHESLHSPNTLVSCKTCHKTFANVYRLQRHMISHDESALLRKFKCTDCDKAFKFKHHLKEHIRIHSGEKPFACNNCGKRFSHSGSYSSHMTSKKCISMGLKLNNNNSNLSNNNNNNNNVKLEKGMNINAGGQRQRQSMQMGQNYLPPTNAVKGNGAFLPMIPNFNNYLASFQNPFFSAPFIPFSMQRILEMTGANANHLNNPPRTPSTPMQSDPEDMIEEVSEDVAEESKLVMDVKEDEKMDIRVDSPRPHTPVHHEEENQRENHSPSPIKHEPEVHDMSNDYRPQTPTDIKEEIKDEDKLQCGNCKETFNHPTELVQHEKVLCGSLQFRNRPDVMALNMVANSYMPLASGSEDDTEDRESKVSNDSERKVRVRTAISEEQQSILKEYYATNARPNREEFRVIAQRLMLDPRVVQVWFQNNRSRERKMGNSNGKPLFFNPNSSASESPASHSSTVENDQPLDLSVKKERMTPIHSPRYGIVPQQHDSMSSGDEAMNLSIKSPISLDSLKPFYPYPLPNDFMVRQTPSPNEATHPQRQSRNPYGLGLVTMDRLFQFAPEMARNPLINRGNSLSPGSERRSWRDDDSRISAYENNILGMQSKRPLYSSTAKEQPDSDGQYVCDQCDKAFSKHSSLARHKYEHSGQRPYKCVECPKAFKHKHHLTEHKRLHSGEKPFQCSKCLKRFSHSGSYSQHMNHRYSYCKPYRE